MGRLDILVHGGCLSELSARTLAQEIQKELPNWDINVRTAISGDTDLSGVVVFPAFLLEGRILTTGLPRKDWLVSKLRAWERGER
ncbi:MAG: hypothetical protein CV090_14685 [Nitrospira sp. WS238]|nr:hypothetical protein [Nitrospira sp. WS238]